jgi:uroporphyrinogen decarboxylase
MDSRERTFCALNHEEPDRVPTDCWMTAGTRRKLLAQTGLAFEAFLDTYDVDLRYIEGPRYVGPAGSGDVDLWGVPRRPVELVLDDGSGRFTETYREVAESPLADCRSVEEVLEYDHWPSPDWFDYSGVEAQCRRIRTGKRVVVFMGDRLNRLAQLKPAMYLRGPERIFLDMIEQPEVARAIFGKIAAFYLEYGRRVLESARGMIDILCTGDDFGAQEGLLVSPAMWDGYLRQGFQDYIALGHDCGAKVMHHSCGSVYGLIPRMIDCGLDILQSIQPEAAKMDPRGLKSSFGARIAFQGGISIQNVLPRGSAEDVRDHVEALFAAMAPGGGFIGATSHNIQVDTPVGSIEALYRAFREFGDYPRATEG